MEDDTDDFADVYYIDTRNAVREHRRPGRPWFQPVRPSRHTPPPRAVAVPRPVYATPPQIVEMIAQGFAAMQSLPGAPVATRDLETDIANMVLYQSALASHAKRDEQWRTLGGLIAKLVG
jgi:hypothetical protein